ncbi:MAG: class B sortase [Clostridia bacterium]|nr:class B sortase [Clostridia bacterium]
MMKKVRRVLLLFFIVVFIGSLINIINYQYELKLEERRIEQLKQNEFENPKRKDIVKENKQQPKETKKPKEKQVLVQYKDLFQENSDLVGWIKIDNTTIDYPVMQTKDDPIFYIHRDWNKKDSITGLPLIDARCTLESENIIIYSHNMKNGSMFGSLKKYKDKSYYEKHKNIKFDTIYEEAEYQIIGVFLGKVYYDEKTSKDEFLYYNYIELNSEKEFDEYIDNVEKLSLYDTGNMAKYGDKLITLCTCDYYTENGRFLVVAKRIQ